MNRLLSAPFVSYLGLLLLLPGPVVSEEIGVDWCVRCHQSYAGRKEVPDWQAGLHGQAGVTCVDCHGGLSGEKDVMRAKGPQTDYLDLEGLRGAMVQRCGRCHEGPGRALAGGAHGVSVRVQEGRPRPTCATCHVAGHRDERATASILRKENCATCHPDASLYRGLKSDLSVGDARMEAIRKSEETNSAPLQSRPILMERIQQFRDLWHRMRIDAHRVDAPSTGRWRVRLEAAAGRVEQEERRLVNRMSRRDRNRRWAAGAGGFLLLFGLVLVRLARSLDRVDR